MTRAEAKKALREGKKLTHQYFTPDEWVKMEGDEIVLEDGVRCSEDEFWRWRTQDFFDEGWDYYRE